MQTSIIKKSLVLLAMSALLISTACSKQESEIASSAPAQSQKTVQSTTPSESASDFEKAFEAANKLRLEAASLEFEWSNTEKFLLDAKKTYADGDKEKAMQLVKQAHEESELAIKQAETEADAWKDRVVK